MSDSEFPKSIFDSFKVQISPFREKGNILMLKDLLIGNLSEYLILPKFF